MTTTKETSKTKATEKKTKVQDTKAKAQKKAQETKTKAKKVTAESKEKASATVSSAKEAVKKFSFGDFFNSIANFFKNLDKAYYVAILAILGIILFFMPWLNITILTKFYEQFHIDFLSGFFAIPQTLLSLFFSVDATVSGALSIVDAFANISNNLDSLHDVTQYINTLCNMLGIQVAANGETVNGIIAAIQNALPSGEQLAAAKQALSSVASMTKAASLGAMLWVLIVVGFNAYTAIICIAKKRITKGCTAAFIIEGIFAFLFILICLSINSVIQSLVFFLPNVLEATGWVWLTLIVCIIGIILCVKYQNKKPAKK